MSETVIINSKRPGEARHPLLWACYLGASWTWCIGMFLPVLLVRDVGVAGFWAFAIPNVLGAAAMGFVLRSADASREVVARNRIACMAFSAVTISFHVFFAGWMIRTLSPWLVGVAVGAFALVYLAGRRRAGVDAWAACLVLALSLAAFAYVGRPEAVWPAPVEESKYALVGLAPVCLFGFLFCPYLDLTFHRADQESARPPVSFGVGFGVLFFAMILFTLAYAVVMIGVLDGGRMAIGDRLAWAIGGHMAVQAGFTVAVHLREFNRAWGQAPARSFGKGDVVLAIVAVVIPLSLQLVPVPGEVVYRTYLGFYGLVFPAYVWLCMFPGLTRRSITVCGVAIALAGPFYALGFLANEFLWLLAGLAIVLAARLFVTVRRPARV